MSRVLRFKQSMVYILKVRLESLMVLSFWLWFIIRIEKEKFKTSFIKSKWVIAKKASFVRWNISSLWRFIVLKWSWQLAELVKEILRSSKCSIRIGRFKTKLFFSKIKRIAKICVHLVESKICTSYFQFQQENESFSFHQNLYFDTNFALK